MMARRVPEQRLVRSDETKLSDEEIAAIDATLVPPPGCIPFSSRAPRAPWYDRADPFALGFGATIQHTWHSYSTTAWKRALGPRGPLWRAVRIDDFTPLSAGLVRQRAGKVERVVAALTSWQVLTSQQLACFACVPVKKLDPVISAMFGAGLLERGRMVASFEGIPVPAMYRLRKGKELDRYFKTIGEDRTKAIMFGQEQGAGGHERHDLLAAEIALRAAETMGGIQGVLGERSAGARDLLFDAPQTSVRGDLVIVRGDGLRVVIEVTTQPRIPDVARKMARWGRLLGERGGIDHTGVVVVFLAASHDGKHGRLDGLMRNFEKAMTPHGLSTGDQPAPASYVHAARSSVFVATSEEWFPERWFISERFCELRTHFSVQGTGWGEVALMEEEEDGVVFSPTERIDWHYLEKVRRRVLAVPVFTGGPLVSHAVAEAA